MKQFRVLFVDDEVFTLQAVERVLHQQPYARYYADSGARALEIMSGTQIDVVVVDMKMPIMDGLGFLREVRDRYPDAVRLVLSAYAHTAQILPCINQGEIFRFLVKPIDPEELQGSLEDAFAVSRKIAYQKNLGRMVDDRSRILLKNLRTRRHLNRKLAMLTNFDERTGLYSQGHVRPALASEIEWCAGGEGDFSCLQIRIDDYRRLADGSRLLFAERVLAGVAARLIGRLTESAIAFRLLRDTILVVSPEMTLQKMDDLGWWLVDHCRKSGIEIDDQPHHPVLWFSTATYRLNLPGTAGELLDFLESGCALQAQQTASADLLTAW